MPILGRVSIRLPGTAALRTLGRAMKGLEVRMARALNKVMHRTGPVFADRYHAHLLVSPREAANAIRYVLENWIVHAERNGSPAPPRASIRIAPRRRTTADRRSSPRRVGGCFASAPSGAQNVRSRRDPCLAAREMYAK